MKHPKTCGPYLLERELGHGGMGKVWEARHQDSGQRVAVKLLGKELTPHALARFRAESRTLARLNHPGVVKFLESGELEEGQPWYAMQLLEGLPLSRWLHSGLDASKHSTHWTNKLHTTHTAKLPNSDEIERASTMTVDPGFPPESVRSAVEIPLSAALPSPTSHWPTPVVMERLHWVAQLCHTLAYIHGLGVVHCDIKPENIVIASSGYPVLVDFGIAEVIGRRISQSEFDVAGIQAGTPHYISPEQIRGDQVDARADLYALGCILYECICGEPPFDEGRSIGILLRHLSHPPRALSEHVEGLPTELGAMVMRLLEKDPAKRTGYAMKVAQGLRAVGVRGKLLWPKKRTAAPRPYLYRTGVTGRQGQLRDFDDLLVQSSPRQEVVLCGITGEDGMGKSRMAAEYIALARRRRFTVISSQCVQEEAVGLRAFEPLFNHIADLGVQSPQKTRDALGEHLELLVPYAPQLARLVDTPPEEVPKLDGSGADRRVFRALASIFSILSRHQPVLYVVDDVHCADTFSLEALERLFEQITPDHGVVFLLLSRLPSESERVDAILRKAQTVRLEALGVDEIHAMAAQMLGQKTLPDDLLTFVVTQTQGNPFYVAEYMHLALERGLLRLDDSGHWVFDTEERQDWSAKLPTPESIQALCHARLADLGEVSTAVCSLLSVWDRPCDKGLLLKMLGPSKALRESLRALERMEILVRGNAGAFKFAHEQLRQAAYSVLEEAQVSSLHRQVALVLEGQRGTLASRLGFHWERAGELDTAHVAYLRGARETYRLQAYRVADRLFEQALSLVDGPEKWGLWLEHVESVLVPLRAFEQASARLLSLLKKLRHPSVDPSLRGPLQARTLDLLGRVELEHGDLSSARRHLREAHRCFERMADGLGHARVFLSLGRLELNCGELEVARDWASRAQHSFMRLDGARGQARSLSLLGEISWRQGRLREAEQTFLQAAKKHKRNNNPKAQAEASVWLAQLALSQGRLEESKVFMERAAVLFQNADDPSGQAQVLILQSRLSRTKNLVVQALQMADQGMTLAHEAGDTHHEVLAMCEMALCHKTLLHKEESTMWLKKARALAGKSTRLAPVLEGLGRVIRVVD